MDNNTKYIYNGNTKYIYDGGISFGTVVAIILSWMKWHSIPWLILHGFLSWIYVIYYFFKYGF